MKTVRFLFNDDMARAIVQGRKTVTRRPIMPQPWQPHWNWYPDRYAQERHFAFWGPRGTSDAGRCSPLWRMPCAPGDILIGRECWRLECTVGAGTEWAMSYRATGTTRNFSTYNDPKMGERCTGATIRSGWLWRPSIHMPDWAARIRRRVVSVTVERLQDITEDDAVREGFGTSEELEEFFRNCAPPGSRMASPRDSFEAAWDSIYAAKGLGWDANPWAWRIEFSAENVQEASNGR